MNVKELRELLAQYPEDMEVMHGMYSDYHIIDEVDWSLQDGVDMGGWVMRSHRTMSEENKQKAKTYLALAGN